MVVCVIYSWSVASVLSLFTHKGTVETQILDRLSMPERTPFEINCHYSWLPIGSVKSSNVRWSEITIMRMYCCQWLLCPSQMTVAFCRTLVVAHCGSVPVICGSCLCREHITNSLIGVSRPPVLDCGTTFHPDYGDRDWPSTPSDNLWHVIICQPKHLLTSEFIGAIQINLSVHLSNGYSGTSVGVAKYWLHCWSVSFYSVILMCCT